MTVWYTDNDLEFLKNIQPGLTLIKGDDKNPDRLMGQFVFRSSYNSELKKFDIIADQDGITLCGSFQIEIIFHPFPLIPEVRETGGYIRETHLRTGVSFADLHIKDHKTITACLCAPMQEMMLINGGKLDFPEFIRTVYHFFYYQVYFREYKKEPWLTYSHGDRGVYENASHVLNSVTKFAHNKVNDESVLWLYFDSRLFTAQPDKAFINIIMGSIQKKLIHNILNYKVNFSNFYCVCGSGKKFKRCHPHSFYGLKMLADDFQ